MIRLRKILSIVLLGLCLLTGGCTTTADRIYSVCKVENNQYYCYKNSEEFFLINKNGSVIPTSGVGLKALPALHVIPTEGNYRFDYVMPGLYKGTLDSLEHYIYLLESEYAGEMDITYRDWNSIEGFIYTDEYNIRFNFNKLGDVRIYAKNKYSKTVEPPYINIE